MKSNYIFLFVFMLLISCNNSQPEIESLEVSNGYIEKIDYPNDYMFESIFYFNDSLLSYNNGSPQLELYDHNFSLISSYKKSGFGPGELQKIDSGIITDSRIIVYDSVKKSFEIFDRNYNSIATIPTEHRIISLVADGKSNLYAGVVDMKQYYIVRFEGEMLDNEQIIFVRDIDELLMGFHRLSIHGDHLFISNIMTNTGVLLNLKSGKSLDFINHELEKQPEFVYQGEYKLPKSPVYRAGVLTNNHFFQLKNQEVEKSIIYRGNYDGKITKKFMFDEQIATMTITEDEFWIYTINSLIKYDLKLFMD